MLLYRIGTKKELPMLANRLPMRVYGELLRGVVILDAEYGEDRDCLQTGGYSVVLENSDDLAPFKAILNYDAHPCEWATEIGRDTGWLSALYVMNDDFSVMAYMPRDIAPITIVNELEDCT